MGIINELQTLLEQVNNFLLALNVNKWYLLLWISAGYIQKIYLADVNHIGNIKLNEVWKTFILGTLFCLGYVLLSKVYNQKDTWVEFFASYIFATSMYEMWIKALVNTMISVFKKNVIDRLNRLLNKKDKEEEDIEKPVL